MMCVSLPLRCCVSAFPYLSGCINSLEGSEGVLCSSSTSHKDVRWPQALVTNSNHHRLIRRRESAAASVPFPSLPSPSPHGIYYRVEYGVLRPHTAHPKQYSPSPSS